MIYCKQTGLLFILFIGTISDIKPFHDGGPTHIETRANQGTVDRDVRHESASQHVTRTCVYHMYILFLNLIETRFSFQMSKSILVKFPSAISKE